MQSANITHTLLKTIDSYSGPYYFIDDMFITGIIAEKAGIPRYETELIQFIDCNICSFFQTPVIYQCRNKEEMEEFWDDWKKTSHEFCRNVFILKVFLLVALSLVILGVVVSGLVIGSVYIYNTYIK